MIDLFISNNVDNFTILNFLTDIFQCDKELIILQNYEDFGLIPISDIKLKSAKCLCVRNDLFSGGNAEILLQLYNINTSIDDVIKQITNCIENYNFSCYVPIGEFDDHIHIKSKDNIDYGVREASDNEIFIFNLSEYRT